MIPVETDKRAMMQNPVSADQAVARLLGFTGRQALLSLMLLIAICWVALALNVRAWLGMFGVMLLPLLIGGLGLLAVKALLPINWRGCWLNYWIALAVFLAISGIVVPWLYGVWMENSQSHRLTDLQVAATTVIFGAMILATPLWQAQSQARALHFVTLSQAALVSELKALQAQVEPHFLYNTLANVRYLTRHDPAKGVKMLDHLVAYLHSALPDMRAATSTSGREFELVRHYLELMAIRFGSRMIYQLDCPAELRNADMPPLMLLSLVENAVRHGVEPKPGPVLVNVSASMVGDRLQILVQDNGAGLTPGVLGSGVGLSNLRKRIVALYGKRASFRLYVPEDGSTVAELLLPLSFQVELPDE